jgi:hypothetical protein
LAPIKLRIGLHTGEVQLRDEGNYAGSTINKTSRLRDLAHGGQTVLSAPTEQLVEDRLPEDAWLNLTTSEATPSGTCLGQCGSRSSAIPTCATTFRRFVPPKPWPRTLFRPS